MSERHNQRNKEDTIQLCNGFQKGNAIRAIIKDKSVFIFIFFVTPYYGNKRFKQQKITGYKLFTGRLVKIMLIILRNSCCLDMLSQTLLYQNIVLFTKLFLSLTTFPLTEPTCEALTQILLELHLHFLCNEVRGSSAGITSLFVFIIIISKKQWLWLLEVMLKKIYINCSTD